MLSDIAETGRPDGGLGWAIHSQRRLDSLVRRGLVQYMDNGRWAVVAEQEPTGGEG